MERKQYENNFSFRFLLFFSCFRFYSFRFFVCFFFEALELDMGKTQQQLQVPGSNTKNRRSKGSNGSMLQLFDGWLRLVALALLALLALGPEVPEQCFKLWWSKNTKNMNFISPNPNKQKLHRTLTAYTELESRVGKLGSCPQNISQVWNNVRFC